MSSFFHVQLDKRITLAIVGLVAVSIAGVQLFSWRTSTEAEYQRERATYERVAWVEQAEPVWRRQYDATMGQRASSSAVLTAESASDATATTQRSMREAVNTASATIEAMQTAFYAAGDKTSQMPFVQINAQVRLPLANVAEFVSNLESMRPKFFFESLDITTQQTRSGDTTALVTLIGRTFARLAQ